MKRFSTLTLLFLLIWSCKESAIEATEEPTAQAEVKMAEWSELAKLMRTIHKDAKEWRKQLVAGQMVNDSIAIYEALISSEPTKEEVTGPVYEGMAANYQAQLDAFLAAQNVDLAKSAYNNLVGACVTCHQTYCPGPVKTIEKLYVALP